MHAGEPIGEEESWNIFYWQL